MVVIVDLTSLGRRLGHMSVCYHIEIRHDCVVKEQRASNTAMRSLAMLHCARSNQRGFAGLAEEPGRLIWRVSATRVRGRGRGGQLSSIGGTSSDLSTIYRVVANDDIAAS